MRHRGGWRCVRCGEGSLVRSNFRLDHAGRATCRNEERCATYLACVVWHEADRWGLHIMVLPDGNFSVVNRRHEQLATLRYLQSRGICNREDAT